MSREATPGLVNAEAALFAALERSGLLRLVRPWLRSTLAWRVSGLTLPTALVATGGSWGSIDAYVASMRQRWTRLGPYVPQGARVLDFGTGIGGNLFGLADHQIEGVGLDINPFYVGQANRLARRLGARDLRFVAYDGDTLPPLGTFDCVVSIGAFERIPAPAATRLIRQLSAVLRPGANFILYLLTEDARRAGFGRLLGPEAYTFWKAGGLQETFRAASLEVEHVERGYPTAGDTFVLRRAPGVPPAG